MTTTISTTTTKIKVYSKGPTNQANSLCSVERLNAGQIERYHNHYNIIQSNNNRIQSNNNRIQYNNNRIQSNNNRIEYNMRPRLRKGTLLHKIKKIEILMLVSRFTPPLRCVKTLNDKTLYTRRDGRPNLPYSSRAIE